MKRLGALLTAVCLLACLGLPALASADVNDFTVTNFSSDETLTRADKQGELQIVERISVNFTDQNHGILRAIPDTYKSHSLQLKVNGITSDTNAPHQFSTYESNGNTVLKIGDPSQTVTGAQEYTIDYTLRNVISFYKDHDELYWNVNGDQWSQPFSQVSATLHLPSGLAQSRQPVCYTGAQNSTTQACGIGVSGSTISAVTTLPLQANQTLTYVAGFKTGYFQPSTWYETLGEQAKPILEVLLPVLILGGGSFIWWLRRGRDAKGTGIIVPQYDAPDGMKPLEAGTIIDFRTDMRDITATIIDLSIRGYIRIIETKKDHLLGKDSLSYSLQLLQNDIAGLNDNEVQLLSSLFDVPLVVGAVADISALRNKLYTTAQSISKTVPAQLTAAGYFNANPLKVTPKLSGSFAVIIFIVVFGTQFLGVPLILGLILGAGIAAFFLKYMPARTAKGVTANEHMQGLKMYLNVAEKDRIQKLQAPNAAYASNAAEPVKTVQLFEKLLPYAMVLGVEKQWAKQFEGLYIQPPSWYVGSWSTFNVLYLSENLNNGLLAATNAAFSAPSSSGSSGFGGGFAGGGGGGGGGGGW